MKVFDAETGKTLFALEGSQEPGWAVFSPDSKLVGIIEMDEASPGVWDLDTGQLRYRLVGHKQSLATMNFSPDNKYIATGGMEGRGSCILWDRDTGELIRHMEGHYSYTSSCRFSSLGDLLLIGTAEHKCQIRDVSTGELLSTIHGHDGRIRDVRFSPDETRLVSWALDDQVIVWDRAEPYANPLLTFTGKGRPLQARWTPDSRQLITSWTDGRIEFIQGASPVDLALLPDFRGNEEEFEHEFRRWRKKYLGPASAK
jgi:WD40 repeat protein